MSTNGCGLPPDDVLGGLLQRAGRGDEDAFARLYDLTCVRLAHTVTAVVRSRDQSLEVVQEVYLQVWQEAGRFDPRRGAAIGWLRTIARRRAVDRVRQVEASSRREQRDAAAADVVAPDVAEAGMARHDATRLRRALYLLSDLQRDALVLTYLQGYTHQEAAGLLKIPLGTLKTRVRAGVITLRHHLEAQAA